MAYSIRRRCVTGLNVMSYINRHAVPILKKYLDDERLSLTQISEIMNFSSLSYFSRYCTKHLGKSPSEYRLSIQPKGAIRDEQKHSGVFGKAHDGQQPA
ncbi:MAG: helix-turn-helix domain-containing protein [Bacteroidales bacterium]|nr:helix-turn-helix domain-containing protein [Bacteroidales bacterium]